MNTAKMIISGLLAITAVAVNAMGEHQADPRRTHYYPRLEQAICQGQEGAFMEVLNEMDVNGYALDGDDYDALKSAAKHLQFDRFGIMEDPIYQKLSPSVIKNDTGRYQELLGDMAIVGYELSDDHLYWLTQLAAKAGSSDIKHILDIEWQNRGL